MDAPVQYTGLAEIPATNPADAHSTKKFGLHQPRPSPGPPSSVAGSSTAATTPARPLACHALDNLYGQDSVRSSDGFDGMYNEGDSDGLDYYSAPPPPPFPRGAWCSEVLLRPCCIYINPLHNKKPHRCGARWCAPQVLGLRWANCSTQYTAVRKEAPSHCGTRRLFPPTSTWEGRRASALVRSYFFIKVQSCALHSDLPGESWGCSVRWTASFRRTGSQQPVRFRTPF
jgi:hypothetical protein